jgi:hypothetical protein
MPTTANFNWVINARHLKSEFDLLKAIPGVPPGQINWFITMDKDAAGEVQLTGFYLAHFDSDDHVLKSSALIKGSATTSGISLDPTYILGSLLLKHNDLLQIMADGIDITLTPGKATYTWPTLPPLPFPGSPVNMLYYSFNIGRTKAPRELYPSPPATGSF